MAFDLTPDPADLTVELVIPKEVAPYFKAWFQDAKKDGENAQQFAFRILGRAALRYNKNKSTLTEKQASANAIESIQSDEDALILLHRMND